MVAEAIKRFQPLIEKYPEFAYVSTARYRLALTHYQLNDFTSATAMLQKIPQAEQSGELAPAPYYLADCLLRQLPELRMLTVCGIAQVWHSLALIFSQM